MTTTIREKSLRFHFGDEWEVVKYDDHAHYRRHMALMEGTKALDLVAFLKGRNPLFLIEVKDFRKAPLSADERKKLPQKIAIKVKDTVAGIMGAFQMDGDSELWTNLCAPLFKGERRPLVVFLLVETVPLGGAALQRQKARRKAILKGLKQLCRWLTTNVLLVNLHEWNGIIPHAPVEDLSSGRSSA